VNILLVHNRYQQSGGEESVVEGERSLLSAHGHDVRLLTVSNETIGSLSSKIRTAGRTVYSVGARGLLRSEIVRDKPDVVHVHNFFPLLSPSVYDACRESKVPVVQTLHNYRLMCLNGLFFRDGRSCEDCLGKRVPWPGVVHACYRSSRVASAPVAAMIAAHRALGTWTEKVNAYIALTKFARRKFVEGGIPASRIAVKPNFVYPDPGIGQGQGDYALFVGRLEKGKGIETLLAAWKHLRENVRLKIVGSGPLAPRVEKSVAQVRGIEWLGQQPKENVLAMMKDAKVLIFPSLYYENLPMVLLEAFAVGLPVIVNYTGNMASLVEHGRTGYFHRPRDPRDLAAQVERALAHPAELERMRRAARAEYETKYTAACSYGSLISIYRTVTNGVGVQP
jgi:glycosyltransferase involved in cell wall biosynthesis